MRRNILLFTLTLVSAFVFGQEQKRSSTSFAIPGQKSVSASLVILEQQPAAMIVVPYSPSVVIDAMKEYELSAYKSKKKQSTAYQAFDNTELMKKNENDASLVFNVGPMNLQKDQSVIYLMLNSSIDKGDNAGAANHFELTDAIAYLNNLSVAVGVISLDRQIKDYTAKLKKVEHMEERYTKRCDRLVDKKMSIQDKVALHKKSSVNKDHRLDVRLKESQDDLAFQKATADKQRSDLASLTNQRNSYLTNPQSSLR